MKWSKNSGLTVFLIVQIDRLVPILSKIVQMIQMIKYKPIGKFLEKSELTSELQSAVLRP